jgi:hypothetical protein
MELLEYIPKDKCDITTVEKIGKVDPTIIQSILPELFVWLQDPNWPVAKELSKILAGFGELIIQQIKKVLSSNDDLWEFCILNDVIPFLQRTELDLIKADIERLAYHPTEDEKSGEVDKIAKEILLKLY